MKGLYAIVVAILFTACSTLPIEQADTRAENPSGQAKPVQQRVPGPLPLRATTPPGQRVNAVKVESRERSTNAVYHQIGPVIQPTIPPTENVTPGKFSIRGRGVPGPINTDRSADISTVQAWTDSSGAFLSTDFDDNGTYNSGFRFIPPDSHAAAGPLHVVNVVNTTFSIHPKDGTLDFRQSLAGFFAALAPLTFTFDPKVIYDQYSDRWLVVTLEQTEVASGDAADTSRIFLAVSDDANPNGNWYVTAFDSRLNIGGNFYWADYPGFSVGEDAVYITANMFPFSTGGFGGVRLWIVDKGVSAGFYAGSTAGFSVQNPYAVAGLAVTTQPAHMFGTIPGNADTYLVGYSGLTTGITDFVQVVRVDTPLGTPSFTQSYSAIGNVDNTSPALPDAPQLGSGTAIEVNDRRALDAVWINDSLWMTTTVLPPSGTNSGETTAYWIEVDTSTPSSLSIADQGEIGGEGIATGAYTFFPSVAVNGYDDVTMGFSASDDSIYAGAYYVTRETGDAAGTTGSAQTVRAGEDYYVRTFGGSRNRWGDYSGTVVDPHDGCFWIYNQYAQTRGTIISGEDGRWATAYTRSCNLTHACSDSVIIPAGTWTRFAMPCSTAPNNKVSDVFSGLTSGDYGSTWIVYRRVSTTPTSYVAMTLTDTLSEGAGYWVFSDNATTVSLSGSLNTLTDIDLFGVTSTGRDNYVGHNQDAQISWADVLFVDGGDVLTLTEADTAGDISRTMYKWNGSAYQVFNGIDPQIGALDPFDAVWVQVFSSGLKIRIPQAAAVSVDSTASTNAAKAPASARVDSSPASGIGSEGNKDKGDDDDDDQSDDRSDDQSDDRSDDRSDDKKRKALPWHVRLTATSGDMQDPGNFFGRIDGGRNRKDIHDLEEPAPFGSRYLTVLFTNPKLKGVDWGFTSDFRKLKKNPKGKWPFVVKASPHVSAVTLSWQGPDFVFEDAWLSDEESGETFKVHSAGSYTFDISGGEHHFTFEIDD